MIRCLSYLNSVSDIVYKKYRILVHTITFIIIQQIVTLSKYGHDALDIRHPQVTDIRRYT